MREIVTVTGTIAPEQIGFCQFHEHLLVSLGESRKVNPAIYMDDIEKSAREAADYRAAGGATLIDAQPGGCSRMAGGLAEISRRTGVHIICSTGFHKLIFYPRDHWIHTASERELAAYFANELRTGIVLPDDGALPNPTQKEPAAQPDAIRAGIVKCALDAENLTPRYRRLFSAAMSAALDCGRTMMVHIERGSDPLALLGFLIDGGMDPRHLVFCHMDRAIPDDGIHREIAARGVFLEYDTIGRYQYHSDEYEAQLMSRMMDAGYEDQLLFSLDTTRLRLRAYTPEAIGLDYILKHFIKTMYDAGITRKQIKKISNENCIRALAG